MSTSMQPDVRYNNANDAVMRLDSSILKYKEEYWYCRIINGLAYLYDLTFYSMLDAGHKVKEAHVVNFNDEELDIRSVTIGYINTDSGAYYITRPPFRKQKQGTSTVNCYIAPVGTMAFSQIQSQTLFSRHVKDALQNKYPSLKGCMRHMMSGVTYVSSMAFAKDFAIKKVGNEFLVYFEQQLVGVAPKFGQVDIYPHCQDSVLTMKLNHMGIEVN